ncbi:hypothetical protein DFA_01939 [Cavenderia fasciculata]|uniref:Uncharacterized protein n=1 Tax=Cavenderia fasciculata TaxID=261658 RepID=F4PQU2_CACFS|nr:uncharacterized protein DFA_01939 [Cavenderia fasciculata]EGG22050.1 hypothetical protein DFA_01939 [Cavenderia fasciculata]|eukprot:XP_004359901.1 hypothetical protein DFA_01939 [Cavenderia fasciculata]
MTKREKLHKKLYQDFCDRSKEANIKGKNTDCRQKSFQEHSRRKYRKDDKLPLDCVFDLVIGEDHYTAFQVFSAAKAASECFKKKSNTKSYQSFPLWTIHPINILHGIVAEHMLKKDDNHSLFICRGHFVRVNNNDPHHSDHKNYAYCILPSCPDVYKVDDSTWTAPEDLKTTIIQCLRDKTIPQDLKTAVWICAFVAAMMTIDSRLVGSTDFQFIRLHPVAGPVMREFMLSFRQWNAEITNIKETKGILFIFLYSYRFAHQIWENLSPKISSQSIKRSYPAFASQLQALQNKVVRIITPGETEISPGKSLVDAFAQDIMDIGLGKTFLGIPSTVLPSPTPYSTKKYFDETIRKPIFRDSSSDPSINPGSAFAEIAVGMAFSELVRWAGTWPMSHNGSVADAQKSAGDDGRLTAVELKSMRLYVRSILVESEDAYMCPRWLIDGVDTRKTLATTVAPKLLVEYFSKEIDFFSRQSLDREYFNSSVNTTTDPLKPTTSFDINGVDFQFEIIIAVCVNRQTILLIFGRVCVSQELILSQSELNSAIFKIQQFGIPAIPQDQSLCNYGPPAIFKCSSGTGGGYHIDSISITGVIFTNVGDPNVTIQLDFPQVTSIYLSNTLVRNTSINFLDYVKNLPFLSKFYTGVNTLVNVPNDFLSTMPNMRILELHQISNIPRGILNHPGLTLLSLGATALKQLFKRWKSAKVTVKLNSSTCTALVLTGGADKIFVQVFSNNLLNVPWDIFNNTRPSLPIVLTDNDNLVGTVPESMCRFKLKIQNTSITSVPSCFWCYPALDQVFVTSLERPPNFICPVTFDNQTIVTRAGEGLVTGSDLGWGFKTSEYTLLPIIPNQSLKIQIPNFGSYLLAQPKVLSVNLSTNANTSYNLNVLEAVGLNSSLPCNILSISSVSITCNTSNIPDPGKYPTVTSGIVNDNNNN